jgi:hypothetical protein
MNPEVHERMHLHHKHHLKEHLTILIYIKDVPIVSLFVAAQNRLIKSYVKGLELNPMDNLYLKDVWIERGS